MNDLKQAFAQEQVAVNDMLVEVAHAKYGAIHLVGVPYKYSASPCDIRQPPPMLGEHTAAVLREKLGMSGEDIASLQAQAVV